MTPATSFAGQKVALFGLGGSGLATLASLKAGGADVLAWDDSAGSRDKARARGFTVTDLRQADWSDFLALILAPGVPLTHPEPHWTIGLARAASVPIIGDIEVFCRERAKIAPGAPFVAITGTNGKSTTTALVAHVLREAGRDVQMGGNIGTAILSLEPPAKDRVHVIEMSSFQIDLTPSLNPSVGVLLNISPDHLDRHGTMRNYAAIKERLVAAADLAVVGIDDDRCRAIAERRAVSGKPLQRISTGPLDRDGILGNGSTLVRVAAGRSQQVAELAGIGSLRGAHNAQNAGAAFAIASALGVPEDAIRAALRTFPGLAHRMEEVARREKVLFVNDSKATNADSTEKALLSFARPVFWIVGGKAKEGGIEPLKPYFTKIERAYLIGEAAEAFAATLEGHVPLQRCGTLDRAVSAAAADASASQAKEPVVLLSPACASYDQYPNFEVRGDHFRDLVRGLPERAEANPSEPDAPRVTRP